MTTIPQLAAILLLLFATSASGDKIFSGRVYKEHGESVKSTIPLSHVSAVRGAERTKGAVIQLAAETPSTPPWSSPSAVAARAMDTKGAVVARTTNGSILGHIVRMAFLNSDGTSNIFSYAAFSVPANGFTFSHCGDGCGGPQATVFPNSIVVTTYGPYGQPFSGFSISDFTDPAAFSSFSIDPDSNVPGFSISNVSLRGGVLYLNFGGVALVQGSFAQIDFPGASPQTITFPLPGNVMYGASPVALNATASSGLPVGYVSNSPTVCTISASTAVIVGAGTCSITASQAGTSSYAAATPVTQTFTVSRAPQTIVFAPLAGVTLAAAQFALTATDSADLPVSFSTTTSAVCFVSGSTVITLGVGTCTITASQAGNSNYLPATNVTQSFTVSPPAKPVMLSCTPTTGPTLVGTAYSSTCSVTGGKPPYSFSISAGSLPAGITLNTTTGAVGGTPRVGGSYSYNLQVADSSAPPQTAIQTYSGTVASSVIITPGSLSFTYRIGDASAPPTQIVSVFGNPPGTGFTVSSSGGSWLSIQSPSNSPASGAFPVSINTLGLIAPGPLNGMLTITPVGGAPVNVPVTLNVLASAGPQLSTAPLSQSFVLPQGATSAGVVTVSNTGGGTLQFSADSDSPNWLTVRGGASATSAAPGILEFTMNTSGANLGLNTGHIAITGAGSSGQAVVTVSLVVSGNANSIQLSETGLSFTADAGGATPPGQSFRISNPGSGALNWTATAQTISGGDWLSVTPSGMSTGGQVGSAAVVSVNQGVLAAGQYYGTVSIMASGASNSPQTLSVLLTVQRSGIEGAGVRFSAGGVVLSGTAGDSTTSATVTLFNPSSTAGSYSSTAAMTQGMGWLSLSPSSGNLASGATGLTVQANLGSLASGIYKGAITLAFDDGTTGAIQVVLLVKGIAGSAQPRASVPQACVTNKASSLVPVFTQPLAQSAAAVAVGQPVQVQVVDDCNNPVTAAGGGAVQVTFSNGDPALTLTDAGGGTWEGTWIPLTTGATVTLQVAAQSGSLTGGSSITAGVNPASANGAAQISGIVNAASGSTATPQIVTPGGFAVIYGNQLASDGSLLAGAVPLPTTLSNTQLLLGGQALPLSYASGGQVNALIPQGLNPNASYTLVVQRDATQSVPVALSVVELQPGIFTVNETGTGQGIVQIAGTVLLAAPTGDGSRPAKSGSEYLQIYGTGLGPVVGTNGEPAPADGAAAALPTIYKTKATVTATLGGIPVPVTFSGLTPTLVALYQINVQLPAGVPTGNAVPLVITATSPDGTSAQSNTVTVAIQ